MHCSSLEPSTPPEVIPSPPLIDRTAQLHAHPGTPAMWRTWLAQAQQNGLNMVQVYVFWNYHEPMEGVYNWGQPDTAYNGNLTLFMEEASSYGIFVNLRIGPYVCAEWTYGGIPAWLGQKPGTPRAAQTLWRTHRVLICRRQVQADECCLAARDGEVL